MRFGSGGLNRNGDDMNEYDKLTPEAQLADKLWRYMLFSGRFDECKPSELRTKYIIPIFGNEVSEEIGSYYMNAKL